MVNQSQAKSSAFPLCQTLPRLWKVPIRPALKPQGQKFVPASFPASYPPFPRLTWSRLGKPSTPKSPRDPDSGGNRGPLIPHNALGLACSHRGLSTGGCACIGALNILGLHNIPHSLSLNFFFYYASVRVFAQGVWWCTCGQHTA